MATITIQSNLGFGGRTFLTKDEWETYLKRNIHRHAKSAICLKRLLTLCNARTRLDLKSVLYILL